MGVHAFPSEAPADLAVREIDNQAVLRAQVQQLEDLRAHRHADLVQEALAAQEVLVAQAAAETDRRTTRTMEKIEAVVGRRVIGVILGRRLMRC